MNESNVNRVIYIRDMPKCRVFYRDILELGAPEIDSPFRVEFPEQNGVRVCLELVSSDSPAPETSPAWLLDAEEDPEIFTRLNGSGCPADTNTVEFEGVSAHSCRDPEGNLFYIATQRS